MTPDQIIKATSLLAQLASLKAQQTAFMNAVNYQIGAIDAAGRQLGTTAIFPAVIYSDQVNAAFAAQIADVTASLTTLGVTGL